VQKHIRVRFAPSPTGDFHVGGARTALFNYLFARNQQGTFILRIEDTDRKRYDEKALERLLQGLRYLGIEWDEGPEVGGEYGPYFQSERLEIYQHYARLLLDDGYAYRCFCPPERLEQVSQERQMQKLLPGYDRHCRTLDPEKAEKRAADGERHTLRMKVPLDGEITAHDAIRGQITFPHSNLQDAVLMKSDGFPTYHLANVVDDHLMNISHILRGDEWMNSLPLHLHLYNGLGWKPPVMAHLPLILNPTGKGKMSKREGRAPDGRLLPVFLQSFQDAGYLPEALINYLALVGWSYDDKTEIMSRDELIHRFSLERVNSSPAAWNYEKLEHFNGAYIRQLTVEDLTDRILPFLQAAGFRANREKMIMITPLIQERIKTLGEAPAAVDFFLLEDLPDYDFHELIPKKGDRAMALKALERAKQALESTDFSLKTIDASLRATVQSLGLKDGQMFQPIRIAVCGRKVSPPLFETLQVLGRDMSLKRIDQAIKKIQQAAD
jgi:glutamyl-tRNA synthetase